jgi:hypothetical protein
MEMEGILNDQIFQQAYARVRGRHTDQSWLMLTPREITSLIYQEMREIDLQRSLPANSDPTPHITLAAE